MTGIVTMNRRAPGGFTLLEVLVATTIFSLVVAVLYAGYRLGIRSWESGERTQAAVAELRLASAVVLIPAAIAALAGYKRFPRKVWGPYASVQAREVGAYL